jgi:hypothetical protein
MRGSSDRGVSVLSPDIEYDCRFERKERSGAKRAAPWRRADRRVSTDA